MTQESNKPVEMLACPCCEMGSNYCRISTRGNCGGVGMIPAGARAIYDCEEFARELSNPATRLSLAFAAWNARHRLSSQQDREAVLEEADELRRVRSAVFAILRRHDVDEQLFAEVAAATFCPPIRLPSASPTMDEIVEVPTGDLREYARFVADLPCETKGAEDLEPGCCLPCRARSLLSRLQEQG
jgi:hypothetical protein